MIKIFRNMNSRQWLILLVSVVLIFFQVQLDLKLPEYMSDITTLVQTEGNAMHEVLVAGGKMLVCALGSAVLAVLTGFLSARLSAGFSATLQQRIYNKIMSFSNEEISRFSTASLITRSTNDITQIQMFIVMGLSMIVRAPITAVLAIDKISAGAWQWTALTTAAVLIVVFLLSMLMLYAIPRFKKIQTLTDDVNRLTRENLTGLLVVRACNAEKEQEAKFEKTNATLTRTQLEVNSAMAFMNPGLNLAMNGLTVGIYWIGAILISNVALTSQAALTERVTLFSDMVVFMNYAMQVVMAFLMMVIILIMFPRVDVSAKRLNEVLDTEVRMKNGTVTQGSSKGSIEFRNVSFSYPESGTHVLKNISFKAEPGQTVALIGATGSGKSTLINLIPRIYDATEGSVLIDGVDVKDWDEDALHKRIGFVPQKAWLFSGHVADTISYGTDQLSQEELEAAAASAEAAHFISGLEDGYESNVAQGGNNFSGGQKQRLSIARAVAKKPEILVFDDSFSALDYKTDRKVRDNLKQTCKDTTKIIVAQRIGTIMDADQILVIHDGQIVGKGTHEQLLKSCDVYQEIAQSQLTKEELEQ